MSFEMIHIFKTDVQHQHDTNKITDALFKIYPQYRINFDLDDCDNILRIEGEEISTNVLINCLAVLGYECTELY